MLSKTFIFIFISIIKLSISENEDHEKLNALYVEIGDDYKNTVTTLQLIYYYDNSTVCSISIQPPIPFDRNLESIFCFEIENNIFNTLQKLMTAFASLTSDQYVEHSRENYLIAVDKTLKMFKGIGLTAANKKQFELQTLFKYGTKWLHKMEEYIIIKFKNTKIC